MLTFLASLGGIAALAIGIHIRAWWITRGRRSPHAGNRKKSEQGA